MALGFRARRSLVNALGRVRHEPRQLLALGIGVLNLILTVGMVVAALVFLPSFGPALRRQVVVAPAAVSASLFGLLALLTVAATFQNRLLRFAQADIDLLFPTPIPTWRIMLQMLLTNHLRALAAAFFFAGLSFAPALVLLDRPLWPALIWSMLALTLLFSTIDELLAALLIWLDGCGSARALTRAGVVAGLLIALLALLAPQLPAAAALLGALQAALRLALFPVALAADTALDAGGVWWRVVLLLLLDMGGAVLLIRASEAHLREAAISPLIGQNTLRAAFGAAGLNPLRLIALLWHPERIARDAQFVSIAGVGRGATVLSWVRLVETRRTLGRTAAAVLALAGLPLLLLDGQPYTLRATITAVMFSTTLLSQIFNDLAEHIRRADIELALPIARWRLIGASLLGRLPIYWLGGMLLLLGAALRMRGPDLGQLAVCALWYPLAVVPSVALRGALIFLWPGAVSLDKSDPIQAAVAALVNGVLTIGLLLLSTLPLLAMLLLNEVFGVGIGWFWLVVFASSGLLCALAFGLLAASYGRYQPSE